MSRLILDPPCLACSDCGGEDFYVRLKVKGFIHDNRTLDRGVVADNGQMWDNVDHRQLDTAYCTSCHKVLGKVIGDAPDVYRSDEIVRKVIQIVTLVLVRDGRMLLAQKIGQDFLILPGGKPEPGEDEVTTLRREILEELGCRIRRPKRLGVVRDAAGGAPGVDVEVTMYAAELVGDPTPQAEIEALHWIDITQPEMPVAPSLRNFIFPYMVLKTAHETKRNRR